MNGKDYKTFKWWLIGQAIILIAAGLIWYGVSSTLIAQNTKTIERLDNIKADRATVEAQLNGINQKLDLIIKMQEKVDGK